MRTDSPFYSHCFDVLHVSPLFAGHAEKTLQDMLLSFHRETWKKNDLSNQELASMIGSVRVVVNRHLTKLKKEGVLETSRKHMHVKNLHSLAKRIEHHLDLH